MIIHVFGYYKLFIILRIYQNYLILEDQYNGLREDIAHSSVLINNSTGPHLLVVGGYDAYDCWLFDINKRIWKQLVSTVQEDLLARVIRE